jgi:tetratricopeptide (TPR) repeat protein
MFRSRLALLCFLPVVCAGIAVAAEQGQYRSRVEIVPGDEIDQGRVLSVEELERQIDGIEDPYARSSAGRHLARHYVEQKAYDKAIAYYRTALGAEGLSDVANREMLRELAHVCLLSENYVAAADALERALAIDLVPAPEDFLLLARAHYRQGNYVAVVAALDRIGEAGIALDPQQMRQTLALYYRVGAWAQCETLLRELIRLEPDNPDTWHQLASVYLQQNKRREALDQLSLARERGVPFAESDLMLLVDLKAVDGNPYGAAETLAAGLQAGELDAGAANYRKLFELWFHARERDRAAHALATAARLSGDTELYLYLAQLQMEQEAWPEMQRTVLTACAGQLQDRFVSRANLYLGISQLKLGDPRGARRSFINATLIGGANMQAAQWLDFMAAEPATEDERRRVEGPCFGSEGKQRRIAAVGTREVQRQTAGGSPPAADFRFRDLPAERLFYSEHKVPLQELAPQIRILAMRMGVALLKSGGSVDGPLQIIATGEGEELLQLALPVRGAPSAGGRYKLRRSEATRVAYRVVSGQDEELAAALTEFARTLREAGLALSGERRLVFASGKNGSDQRAVELQLGIVP